MTYLSILSRKINKIPISPFLTLLLLTLSQQYSLRHRFSLPILFCRSKRRSSWMSSVTKNSSPTTPCSSRSPSLAFTRLSTLPCEAPPPRWPGRRDTFGARCRTAPLDAAPHRPGTAQTLPTFGQLWADIQLSYT